MISGEGCPGNAEELATGLGNAQSWISGEDFPGDPEELATGLAMAPQVAGGLPPWVPKGAPKGPASWGPKGPHGLRVAPDLARGGRRAALRAPCTWVWALGPTRGVWGWSPSVYRGSGGRSPPWGQRYLVSMVYVLQTLDVQGS